MVGPAFYLKEAVFIRQTTVPVVTGRQRRRNRRHPVAPLVKRPLPAARRAPEPQSFGELYGLSLWLLPAPMDTRRLKRFMVKIRRNYPTPSFAPHLTVLGQVKAKVARVRKVSRELAAEYSSCRLSFPLIRCSSRYFRAACLTGPRKSFGNVEAVRRRALHKLGLKSGNFSPHLSVYYGHLKRRERHGIVSIFSGELPVVIGFDRLAVVRTQGDVTKWKILGVYTLAKK